MLWESSQLHKRKKKLGVSTTVNVRVNPTCPKGDWNERRLQEWLGMSVCGNALSCDRKTSLPNGDTKTRIPRSRCSSEDKNTSQRGATTVTFTRGTSSTRRRRGCSALRTPLSRACGHYSYRKDPGRRFSPSSALLVLGSVRTARPACGRGSVQLVLCVQNAL